MRILFSFIVVLWSSVVWAETRVALVIGNSAYQRAGVLPNAVGDAQLLADGFRATGFDVTLLTDLDEDGMGRAIDAFTAKAQSAEVAAVYFAGHGIQHQRRNYLIPVDARLASPAAIEREAITLDQIMAALDPVPVSLIFLDACRNNPFSEALLAQSQASDRAVTITFGLAVVQTTGNQLVAFATLPDMVASDGTGGNSPFARALARHMPTPGVEVSVMMKRVTQDVMVETGGAQRPQQLSQMGREFYFGGGPKDGAFPAKPEPLLTVYPSRVRVGEEVAVVADLPPQCLPFFFALAPSGKLTPIPRRFFRTVSLRPGQTRYEISPGSRYGLQVLPEDETGQNHLGYLCEPPPGTGEDGLKTLLRESIAAIRSGQEEGAAVLGAITARFQARPFTID